MSQDSDVPCGVLINLPVAEPGQVESHPAVGARVRVVSDGTWAGTRVTANGKPVHGVVSVAWEGPGAPERHARLYLELTGVPVELEGDHERVTDGSVERPEGQQ